MDLQDIQLTEADFNMLIKGLDLLPEEGSTGRLVAELLGAAIAGNDPRLQAHLDNEVKKRETAHNNKKQQLEEEVTLLKSKLILLKRYLLTNGALKTTNKILGND